MIITASASARVPAIARATWHHDRRALPWRYVAARALALWLVARVLDVTLTLLVTSGNLAQRFSHWAFWDADMYGWVAQHGYDPRFPYLAAYFPLYPLAMHPLIVAGLSWQVAAILIANLATLLALIFVGLLVWQETRSQRATLWALVALTVSPLGVFLAGMYSDSLFIALAAAAFLAARRGHWRWAGVALALAIVTRPFGVALALALTVEFVASAGLRRSRRAHWREAPWLIIPPILTLGAFLAALWRAYGSPLVMLQAEEHTFSHVFRWPWQTLALALEQLVRAPLGSYTQIHVLLDLIPVLACLFAALALARRWPVAFTVCVLAVVALCLATPIVYRTGLDTLASDGRYTYAAAPLLLIPIGQQLARMPRLSSALALGLSLMMQLWLTAFVLHGGWLV